MCEFISLNLKYEAKVCFSVVEIDVTALGERVEIFLLFLHEKHDVLYSITSMA